MNRSKLRPSSSTPSRASVSVVLGVDAVCGVSSSVQDDSVRDKRSAKPTAEEALEVIMVIGR
jgi:hypothetical protein